MRNIYDNHNTQPVLVFKPTHHHFLISYPLPFLSTQIKASRRIKKLLTGRLTSHVSTYPAFPGNEANYLRALIARIGAATVVAPSGR